MCIDPEYFECDVPKEMICPICFHVFCYPNTVMDNNGHEYCSTCIEKWLKTNSRCPLDNTYLDAKMLKPIGLMAKGLLANLKVRCKFCNTTVTLDILDVHEKSCTAKKSPVTSNPNFSYSKDHKSIPSLWNYTIELKDELNNLKQMIEKFNLKTEASRYLNRKKSKYSRKFIEKKIKDIGKAKINYRDYLQKNYFWNRFAINANGSFIIFCYNNYDAGELLLFDSKFKITKQVNVKDAKSHYVVGMTNEVIYLACIVYDTEADELNNKKIQVDSYGLDMIKIGSYTKYIPFLAELYPIDVNDREIYLKTSSRTNSTTLNYEIHVLSKNLVEIHSFHLKTNVDVLSIKVRNDFIVYTTKENNIYTFQVQSLRNQMFCKTFDVDAHDTQLSWDMGENSNLFLLNCNTNKISEYNFNGKLLKCTRINVDPSGIIISPCFDFIIPNVFIDVLYVS